MRVVGFSYRKHQSERVNSGLPPSITWYYLPPTPPPRSFYGRHRVQHMAANFDFIKDHKEEATTTTNGAGLFFAMRKPADPENKLFVPDEPL